MWVWNTVSASRLYIVGQRSCVDGFGSFRDGWLYPLVESEITCKVYKHLAYIYTLNLVIYIYILYPPVSPFGKKILPCENSALS